MTAELTFIAGLGAGYMSGTGRRNATLKNSARYAWQARGPVVETRSRKDVQGVADAESLIGLLWNIDPDPVVNNDHGQGWRDG